MITAIPRPLSTSPKYLPVESRLDIGKKYKNKMLKKNEQNNLNQLSLSHVINLSIFCFCFFVFLNLILYFLPRFQPIKEIIYKSKKAIIKANKPIDFAIAKSKISFCPLNEGFLETPIISTPNTTVIKNISN